MNSFTDTFLFINKNAQSASLSNNTDGDKFHIQSYVQSKCRKGRRRATMQQTSCTYPPTAKTSTLKCSSHDVRQSNTIHRSPPRHVPAEADAGTKRSSIWLLITRVPRSPSMNDKADPFDSTAVAIDEQTYRLLQYPFSDYVLKTFTAEGLGFIPGHRANGAVRHCNAIINRMRRCIEDELTMYATLTYSSSCVRWVMGQQQMQRPPEYFLVKAIEALRIRLQCSDVVDSWLVLAVYALSVSGLWVKDYEAASMHLKILRNLIVQLGGMRKLNPYVLENLIIGDKYLALSKCAAPILPFDWDPVPYKNMLKPQHGLDTTPQHEASVLLGMDKGNPSECVFSMMRDAADCLQTAHHIWTQSDTDSNDEHWLFLRHQALIYRLLSLVPRSDLEECCRITLIMLLLHATMSVGARRSLERMVQRLRVPLLRLKYKIDEDQMPLLLWITSIGAMTAQSPPQRIWFVNQTLRILTSLRLRPEKIEYRRILERYLFLEYVQGVQFKELFDSIRETECEDWELESDAAYVV